MDLLIQIAQLFTSLSLLVILHELGHFIPAKIFGCRVNSFYLFFNPKFSLFKKIFGETAYGIGWLPLGGYVKIAGMVDESMDSKSLEKEPQPWEFRSKPAWQRLIVMLGGVTVNVILAVLIFGFTTYHWGTDKLPLNQISKYGLAVSEAAEKVGFRNGDVPYKVGTKKAKYYRDFMSDIMINNPEDVTVLRNGKKVIIPIDKRFIKAMVVTRKVGLFHPRILLEVDTVLLAKGAFKGGIKKYDRIIAYNNEKFNFFDESKNVLLDKANETIKVTYIRNSDTAFTNVKLDENGLLGFGPKYSLETEHIDYNSLSEAFSVGNINSYNLLKLQFKSLSWMFDPEIQGYKGVGSFISMTKMFAPVWNWRSFWGMTAMLALMLAFMNVLPRPALDGGHALFLIYEIIFRRKPSQKFLEKSQMVGMVILLTFMVFAIGNDLFNL